MSSLTAPRCRHIKVNGTQCGSPALRNKNFCFYHKQNRPVKVDCYYNPDEYPTGEIALPVFEDAHSIQSVIRQFVQMVLQKRLEPKTAGTLLYALQIASSNLKRMELEKPQPEQVVVDFETEPKSSTPIAARDEDESPREIPASAQHEWNASPANASTKAGEDRNNKEDENENDRGGEDLPGTIQACYRPYDRQRPLIVNTRKPRAIQ
jgi:hypothetical protein